MKRLLRIRRRAVRRRARHERHLWVPLSAPEVETRCVPRWRIVLGAVLFYLLAYAWYAATVVWFYP